MKMHLNKLVDNIIELIDCNLLELIQESGKGRLLYERVSNIPAEDYTVGEWKVAIKYLTGNSVESDDRILLKNKLLNYILESNYNHK